MRNSALAARSYGLPGLLQKGPVFAPDDALAGALNDISKTVTEGAKAFEEFKAKNDQHLAEVKRGFDDVVRRSEIERIDAAIEASVKANEALQARLKRQALYGYNPGEKGYSHEEAEEKAFKWFAGVNGLHGRRVGRDDFTEEKAKQVSDYSKAFEAYVRHKGDDKLMSPDQMKALSVGSDPDGGYLVSPDMSGRMISRIFETSPMRQYANVQTIGVDALEGLHDSDEADSGWVGETGARSATGTPQLEKWRIPVHELYAKPSATQKLLDDASVNIEAWLNGKVVDKFARTENTAFVTGNGVDRPRGFTTYPDRASIETFEIGAVGRYKTGANGAFAAAPNGGDALINALYGLKAQYRNSAVWFMNRRTMAGVRKLKDTDGAYLWQPGIAAGQPSTILGYPAATFEDMADFTSTGALAIAVGDMNSAYQIVDRIGVRVLRDPYSNKPYVEFYSTKRVGGDLVNFEAIKLVEFSN